MAMQILYRVVCLKIINTKIHLTKYFVHGLTVVSCWTVTVEEISTLIYHQNNLCPFFVAFVCHHNTYLIYGSLRRRSLTRFSIVSHVSVSASFVFCIVLGLAGFLTVLGETQGKTPHQKKTLP